MASELGDYKVIKEGEAEILMHAKNEVFYNKTQVNNRDLSIAVLRTFISKRKEEHDAVISRKAKPLLKKPDENGPVSVLDEHLNELEKQPAESDEQPTKSEAPEERSNGDVEILESTSREEGCTGCDVTPEAVNGKGRKELKPTRVLEALSASGLRALRYAREVDGVGQVVALDNDKASVEAFCRNIKFNGSVASSNVESHLADARMYMITHPKEFDVQLV